LGNFENMVIFGKSAKIFKNSGKNYNFEKFAIF